MAVFVVTAAAEAAAVVSDEFVLVHDQSDILTVVSIFERFSKLACWWCTKELSMSVAYFLTCLLHSDQNRVVKLSSTKYKF